MARVLGRSFDHAGGKSALHMVSAWALEQRLVERGAHSRAVQQGCPPALVSGKRRRLDVVMNEDQDRTRMGAGSKNLVILRHTAVSAIEKVGPKGSLRGKFKRASLDENYLSLLLELF
jgi:hypothetical protein